MSEFTPNETAAVAVRPNRNRPGCLTIHPVGRRGAPDYDRCAGRAGPEQTVYLRQVRPHIALTPARRIGLGLNSRTPCAALVGVLDLRQNDAAATAPADPAAAGWQRVWYDPRTRYDAFTEFAGGQGRRLEFAARAALRGRKAWTLGAVWAAPDEANDDDDNGAGRAPEEAGTIYAANI